MIPVPPNEDWRLILLTILPTASLNTLGSGQWRRGPTAVGLNMKGPWGVGALADQQWSITGWSDRKVNQLLTPPFLDDNLPDGWSFALIGGDVS